jgi:hypothetical protein
MVKLNQRERRCAHRKRLERDDEDCSRLETRGLISKHERMRWSFEWNLIFTWSALTLISPSGLPQALTIENPSATLSFKVSALRFLHSSSLFLHQSHSNQQHCQRPKGNFHPPTLNVIHVRLKWKIFLLASLLTLIWLSLITVDGGLSAGKHEKKSSERERHAVPCLSTGREISTHLGSLEKAYEREEIKPLYVIFLYSSACSKATRRTLHKVATLAPGGR